MSNRNKQTPELKASLSFAPFTFLVGSFESVAELILEKIAERKSTIILPCSLNDLAIARKSKTASKHYSQVDICTTDGMPLVWWAKWRIKNDVEGVRGSDLMKEILTKTQGSHFRHYFITASDNALTNLQGTLKKLAPKVNVAGKSLLKREYSSKTEDQILKSIKKEQPTILWLGIGSPKGVELAATWRKHLPDTTIFCVGAAIELVSGAKPSAPIWMQRAGLEWSFRLAVEPERLWKRYLVDIPLFLFSIPFPRLRKSKPE